MIIAAVILSLSFMVVVCGLLTLLMLKMKCISKKKAFSYFTWLFFIFVGGLYFKLFGDQHYKDLSDIWFICAMGYTIVYGAEDWGMYDQNN
ncbi:hypothetical protein Q5M45_03020 [Acinetobacter pittii]|uniref:hypothetical protein n=1 Tax=Acinetobacter pittii TaxID=48296 RepID=UPI0026EC35BB|nr:hypothetical protein [Acinetobacter pittii]MDO7196389.1 hypothetical protein [Acinetobacter pittii]